VAARLATDGGVGLADERMSEQALVFVIAWRSLWRNPRRTGITLAVVMVGTWSILAFWVFLEAWAASSRDAALRGLTAEGQIHAAGYRDDPDVARRFAVPAAALGDARGAWAARVRVPAIVRSEYRTRAITLVGVMPERESEISDLPSAVVEGRYLSGSTDSGIVIGRDLARHLRTRLGKRIIVMAQDANGRLAERGFVIVGLLGANRAIENAFAFTGLATSQRLLDIGSDVSEVAYDAPPGRAIEQVTAQLHEEAPGLDVASWKDLEPLAYTVERFSGYYVNVWLLIVFVLMAIGIVNTVLMAVFERTREFGLLLALGMRPGLIALQVTFESALLIGIGVLGGVLLIVATVAPLRHGLDLGFLASGAELFGAGRMLYPKLLIADVARASLIVWIFGIAATLWPARRAARVPPIVAMSTLT